MDLIPVDPTEKKMRSSIIKNLILPSSTMVMKELKDFTFISGELYFQDNGGGLAHAISMTDIRFLVTMMR